MSHSSCCSVLQCVDISSVCVAMSVSQCALCDMSAYYYHITHPDLSASFFGRTHVLLLQKRETESACAIKRIAILHQS